MSLYIETIKLLDGDLQNLQYHQNRFERTRSHAFRSRSHPQLKQVIQIPDGLRKGLLKCRVIYGKEVVRIEYEPYEPGLIRSLKLIFSDTISYGFKSADRSALDALYQLRGTSDDILIVKNGCMTDSYYANVIFWNEDGWFTPDTPLLQGTMRAFLLANGSIKIMRIKLDDLGHFQKIRLINAMNSLHDGIEIPMKAVTF